MKKSDLGQTMNTLANVGVIAGIVFLAIEVRNASDANRLQSLYSGTDGFNEINLTLAANPELARIFVVGLDDPDRLNNTEAAQLSNLMRSILNQGNAVWTAYNLGLIEESQWQFSANQIAQIFSTPGGQQYQRASPATSDYEVALEPYMGQEMQSNFSLGRDPSDF